MLLDGTKIFMTTSPRRGLGLEPTPTRPGTGVCSRCAMMTLVLGWVSLFG